MLKLRKCYFSDKKFLSDESSLIWLVLLGQGFNFPAEVEE